MLGAVHIGIVITIKISNCVDHDPGLLTRGRAVKIHQRLFVHLPAQNRKLFSDFFPVDHAITPNEQRFFLPATRAPVLEAAETIRSRRFPKNRIRSFFRIPDAEFLWTPSKKSRLRPRAPRMRNASLSRHPPKSQGPESCSRSRTLKAAFRGIPATRPTAAHWEKSGSSRQTPR